MDYAHNERNEHLAVRGLLIVCADAVAVSDCCLPIRFCAIALFLSLG